MTIINDIKIKDLYVFNLPENEGLSTFARKNGISLRSLSLIITSMKIENKVLNSILLPRPTATPSKIKGEIPPLHYQPLKIPHPL